MEILDLIKFLVVIPWLVTAVVLMEFLVPCLPGITLAIVKRHESRSLARKLSFILCLSLFFTVLIFPNLRIDDLPDTGDITVSSLARFMIFGGSLSELSKEVEEEFADRGIMVIVLPLILALFWGLFSGYIHIRLFNFLVKMRWKKTTGCT